MELRHTPATITRTLDEKSRSVRVVASTDTLDGHGTILEQDWDLRRFRKNPVVLYAHNSTGFLGPFKPEETLPIGRATDIAVVGGRLEATIRFASAAASPMAELVWQGIREGSLSGVSVGFRPSEVRKEKRDGRDVVVLGKPELFELSVVPVGSNPDAVALRSAFDRSRVNIDTGASDDRDNDPEVRELSASERLLRYVDTPKPAPAPVVAPAPKPARAASGRLLERARKAEPLTPAQQRNRDLAEVERGRGAVVAEAARAVRMAPASSKLVELARARATRRTTPTPKGAA